MKISKPRGFAAMSEEKRRAIASKGGKNSPGNFKNNKSRAAELGRKGGLVRKDGTVAL